MFKTFNYHAEGYDQDFRNIIESIKECTKKSFDQVADANREENLKLINEAIVKYSVEGTRYAAQFEAKGASIFKNPQVTKDRIVRSNFNAVIAEVINAIAPAVTSAKYAEHLAEVRQVGFGDTARFIVKSNDLFKVNSVAEGVARGVLEPLFDNEFTVNASPIEIATSIDFYDVAAGVFEWDDFALRAGRSFEGYIFLKIIAAMTSAITQMGAGYSAAGFTDTAWTNICQRVSAANGGVNVYGIGTIGALSKVFPTTVGLQYGLGKEIAEQGHLDKYLAAKLIPVDNVLIPGTTNTSAYLAIPDNKIYIVPGSAYYRPVKVVFEGDSITIEEDAYVTADRTYNISIKMRVGVAAVVGSKIGCITLAG